MKKYKLGDLIDVSRGKSLAGEFYATSGNLVRLTMGNFDYINNCFKQNTSKDNLFFSGKVEEKFILNAGDIITPLTEQTPGLLGSTARIPESGKYIQSQDVALVRCKKDKLDDGFAYYLISSESVKKQLGAAAQQTKIRHTSPDKIKDCTVYIPEISTQKKIGSILSTLDQRIENLRAQNRVLEQTAKTIYDYTFLQCAGRKTVYNKTLKRNIPEGWEVKKMEEVLQPIERGISYSSEEIKSGKGMPMYNLACFDKQGNYRSGELKFYSGEYKTSDLIKLGDMLIACTDLTRNADIIGTPVIVNDEYDMFVYTTDLAKITPKNEEMKYHIYFWLKNSSYRKYIKPFASGTNVLHLNVRGVLDYPILVPNSSALKKFNAQVEQFSEKQLVNAKQIETLTTQRNTLLPLLMTGQVVVG